MYSDKNWTPESSCFARRRLCWIVDQPASQPAFQLKVCYMPEARHHFEYLPLSMKIGTKKSAGLGAIVGDGGGLRAINSQSSRLSV